MKNKYFILIITVIFLMLNACSLLKKDKDEQAKNQNITKKKRIEPNAYERAQQSIDEGGSIIFGKKDSGNKFGNYNIMWRATLDVFENLPIALADYSGSIISTDWYTTSASNESIKIKVEFLSDEVKLASIKLTGNKKTCNSNLSGCKIEKTSNSFNSKIKDAIFARVRDLNSSKN